MKFADAIGTGTESRRGPYQAVYAAWSFLIAVMS